MRTLVVKLANESVELGLLLKEVRTGRPRSFDFSSRLVENMGGRIGVESAEGRGTTFHFTVAANREAPPEARTLVNAHAGIANE